MKRCPSSAHCAKLQLSLCAPPAQDFPSLDHLIAEWKKRPYGTTQQQHAQQPQQAQPPAPPPPQEEEGPYAQQAQQVPPPPPGQYGGYYDGQQYGAYPQQGECAPCIL